MPDWLTGQAIWLWAIYSVVLLLTARPLGAYLYRVFTGGRTFLHPILRPVEVGIYRLTRVDEEEEMSWYVYLLAS
ncbi:MAG: potassium-transporting ATPase subunit KdpA, partial [Chloroflexi bacterium]|nr:potassium-transporting ATPase subunit KdpA [Chloroflexota bacterium]